LSAFGDSDAVNDSVLLKLRVVVNKSPKGKVKVKEPEEDEDAQIDDEVWRKKKSASEGEKARKSDYDEGGGSSNKCEPTSNDSTAIQWTRSVEG